MRWDLCLSVPFSVSNGVRQGSVLSPYYFAVYLDSLLSNSGVGCYRGCCLLVRLLMWIVLFCWLLVHQP